MGRKLNNTPVLQLDKDTLKIIKKHTTMHTAAKAVRGDASSISKACRGVLQTTRGFRWAFSKEVIK